MSDSVENFKEVIKKKVKDYRNGFDYVLKKLENTKKLDEAVTNKILNSMKKHFDACDELETFPEPQTCLDIFNEMNPNFALKFS